VTDFLAAPFWAAGVFFAGAAVLADSSEPEPDPVGSAGDGGSWDGSLRAVDAPGDGAGRLAAGGRVALVPSSTARVARFRIAARR
jgi:hypothetical protein